MSIRINLGDWGSVFAIPTSIVDKHLKIASPLQLKVILFLLRNSQNTYSPQQLSQELFANEEDVADSIQFWVERGVIYNSENEYKPANLSQEKPEEITPAEKTTAEEKPTKKRVITRITKPNLIDAAQRVAADESLQHLLAEVESALSKPLSSGDTSTIVMLYDTCGLPAEVIAMLVHYCVSIEKGNLRTIEKIGLEWTDSGIDSLEKAESRIQQVKENNNNWNTVKGAFGIKNAGSPTKKQLEYAQKWIGQWHFSVEMLRTAYELCVDNTGQLQMPYINKILSRWHSAGIVKIEDIEKLDAKKTEKTQTKTKPKASYDIDELEKIQ